MKQYKIFENSSGSRETIKQGWSWPAFFFGFIWAFVKKMYLLGIGLIVVFFLVGLIGTVSGAKAMREAVNAVMKKAREYLGD